jgi:hypothetical protein
LATDQALAPPLHSLLAVPVTNQWVRFRKFGMGSSLQCISTDGEWT